MPGEPAIDDLLLLLAGGPTQLQRVATVADLHHTVVPGSPSPPPSRAPPAAPPDLAAPPASQRSRPTPFALGGTASSGNRSTADTSKSSSSPRNNPASSASSPSVILGSGRTCRTNPPESVIALPLRSPRPLPAPRPCSPLFARSHCHTGHSAIPFTTKMPAAGTSGFKMDKAFTWVPTSTFQKTSSARLRWIRTEGTVPVAWPDLAHVVNS